MTVSQKTGPLAGRGQHGGGNREGAVELSQRPRACTGGGAGSPVRCQEEGTLDAEVTLGHGVPRRSSWELACPLLGNTGHQRFLKKGQKPMFICTKTNTESVLAESETAWP